MPISGDYILLYEKKGKIVIITLNRPERLNAMSVEMHEKLERAWATFRDDNDAWVAVLTGAGDRSFCSGFDLQDLADRDKRGLPRPKVLPEASPINVWKPVIAAINGFAIAGGMMLAHDCDIRIAAEHAEFGVGETRWNMPASWVRDITRVMQMGHAMEMILWGDRRVSAQRAYEMGLVNKVVPKEKLMAEAMEWADRMQYLAPRCVQNLKQIIYRGFYWDPDSARVFAKALEQNLVGMEDSVEGPKAFAETRKPVFKNK